MSSEQRRFWPRMLQAVREVLYGMVVYDMERFVRRERASMETLFVLVSFGDLLGVPILPPYYALRLLPFVVPDIHAWRRRMLRERDLTDLIG